MQPGTRQILSKRQQLWHHLQHCFERLPDNNQIVVCGNTKVHIDDPKYIEAAQKDK